MTTTREEVESFLLTYKDSLPVIPTKTQLRHIFIRVKMFEWFKVFTIQDFLADYKHGDSSTISFTIDSDLKAGFIVKIGDEVLDLSVKGRIKKLINQLNI